MKLGPETSAFWLPNAKAAEKYHRDWVEKLDPKGKARFRKWGRQLLNRVGLKTPGQKAIDYHRKQLQKLNEVPAVQPVSEHPHIETDGTLVEAAQAESARIIALDRQSRQAESGHQWSEIYKASYVEALQAWEKGDRVREDFRAQDLKTRQTALIARNMIRRGELEAGVSMYSPDLVDAAEAEWEALNEQKYEPNDLSDDALFQRHGWQSVYDCQRFMSFASDNESADDVRKVFIQMMRDKETPPLVDAA